MKKNFVGLVEHKSRMITKSGRMLSAEARERRKPKVKLMALLRLKDGGSKVVDLNLLTSNYFASHDEHHYLRPA